MNSWIASRSLSRGLLNHSTQRPDCMEKWALRRQRREETTCTGPSSLYGELPSKPQSASAAFTVCHSEPLIQRAENIWSSDYYGSPVPFNVSFQACDMWLFGCSLIALNNQREGLDIDMTHTQEWASWLVLLINGRFGFAVCAEVLRCQRFLPSPRNNGSEWNTF